MIFTQKLIRACNKQPEETLKANCERTEKVLQERNRTILEMKKQLTTLQEQVWRFTITF